MRDLTGAGRAVVASPPASPTPIAQIEARARHRRRRHVRAGVAFATAFAVIAGALFIAIDRNQSEPLTARRAPHPKTKPHASTPRMRAHLGVGMPEGWVPVDYGAARLWVPPDWDVTEGGCPNRNAKGWLELGGPYKEICAGLNVAPGTAAAYVSMTSLDVPPPWETNRAFTPTGMNTRVINTYPVFFTHGNGRDRNLSVPALATSLYSVASAAADRVIRTLAPSARTIALATPAQPVPSSWHRVEYDGISVAVPAAWPKLLGSQPTCAPLEPLHVRIGDMNGTLKCKPTLNPQPPADGVWLRHAEIERGSVPTPVRGAWSEGVDVRLPVEQQKFYPILSVAVFVNGNSTALDIGLGRDGRVANAILHSIAVAAR